MENSLAITSQQTGFVERMLGKIESLEAATQFGSFVIKSGFAPPHYKTPEQCILAIDAGMRLGFTWSQSLQEGYVVNGIPSYKAMGFKALVLNSGQCEKWQNEWEGTMADGTLTFVITHRRKGDEKDSIRKFGIPEAQRAGLWAKNDVWKKNPEIMLESRCTARVCEKDYPDVCKGFKTVETAEDYPTEIITESGMTVKSISIDKSEEITEKAKGYRKDKGKPEKNIPIEENKAVLEAKPENEAPAPVKEEKANTEAKTDITEGMLNLKGPDLWERVTSNWPYPSIDPIKLYNTESNPRTAPKVRALLTAISDGSIAAHLSEKYGIVIGTSTNSAQTENITTHTTEKATTSATTVKEIVLPDYITEPTESGRDMIGAVKVADFMEGKVSADKILEMYPDSFNDIEDFFKHATIEQIKTALK